MPSNKGKHKGGLKERTKEKVQAKRPAQYNVIMYNDNETDGMFVVEVLCQIFNKSFPDAFQTMSAIHFGDHAVVGVYSKDVANTKKNQAEKMADEAGYPLRLSVSEAE